MEIWYFVPLFDSEVISKLFDPVSASGGTGPWLKIIWLLDNKQVFNIFQHCSQSY